MDKLENILGQIDANMQDYEQALFILNSLSDKIRGYELNQCIKLIKGSSKLQTLLKIIVDKNIELIKQNKLDNLFNETIILLINAYCVINDICINEENIEDPLTISDDLDDSDIQYNSLRIFLNEISKLPVLSQEEEKELCYKILNGDEEAKKILVERNLGLVVGIAKKYINRGLYIMDLIQEGNLGLMNAADKFDVTLEYRFSTYATLWVSQTIKRAIENKSRNIRIPNRLVEKVSKYVYAKNELEGKLNRGASTKEVAEYLNIPFEKIDKLEKLRFDTMSLNQPASMNDEDSDELECFVQDDNSLPFDDLLIMDDLKRIIKDLFVKLNLSNQEIEVIKMRKGFYNDYEYSLSEIGKMLHITREGVRQIEAGALNKLRSPLSRKMLNDYINKPDDLSTILFQELYSISQTSYFSEVLSTLDLKDKVIINTILEYYNDESNFMDSVPSIFGIPEARVLDIVTSTITKYNELSKHTKKSR